MRKRLFIKIVVILTAISLAVFLMEGCNKKANGQASGQSMTSAQRLSKIKTTLSGLVKDNTINQSQSDQILKVFTTMIDNMKKRSGASGSHPEWSGSGSRPNFSSGSHPQWSGSRPSGASGGNFQSAFSPLGELVKSGVITQDQADTVMMRITASGAMGSQRAFGGQGGQGGPGQGGQQQDGQQGTGDGQGNNT